MAMPARRERAGPSKDENRARGRTLARAPGMDPLETRTVLRLLHAVATADGSIGAEERRALTAAAEELRTELEADGPVDMAAEAARIRSQEVRVATFEAAVALATVDGRCTPEEHATLERLRAALGLDLPMPVADRERTWEARMRTAREAMRAAEVDFLHGLAKRRDVAQDEYLARVEELHRAQVEALHETFGPALESPPSYVVLPPR